MLMLDHIVNSHAVDTWQERLKPAHFKGVPFYIDKHELSGGRRVVDHVFPLKDTVWTEDMGRKQRVFSLDLFLLDKDYFAHRDKLLAVLEEGGPGILSHPYLGIKTVEAVSYSMSEGKEQGGMVTFNVTFHETDRVAPAFDTYDAPGFMDEITEDIDQTLLEEFMEIDTSFMNDIDLDIVTDYVKQAGDILDKAAKFIPDGDFGITDLYFNIRNVQRKFKDLILKPLRLAGNVLDGMMLLRRLSLADFKITALDAQKASGLEARPKRVSVRRGVEARKPLETVVKEIDKADKAREKPPVEPNADIRGRGQRFHLTDRITQLVRGAALTRLTAVSMETDYGTYEDALRQRQFLVSEIEKILEDPRTSDELYKKFQDLRILAVQGIPGPSSDLSRLTTVEPVQAVPSLVLSYSLYGTTDFEDDIVMRNRVANPAFVPAKPIEVLAGV